MRITGSGDPRTPFDKTLPGKLPQRKITTEAAAGYSSYGNQIGLAGDRSRKFMTRVMWQKDGTRSADRRGTEGKCRKGEA